MVRRRYLVALFVVAIGAIATAVVPPEIHRLKTAASKHGLAEAIAAIDAVKFPRDFTRITSPKCAWYRCFYVGKPSGQVAPSLLGLLGRMGVDTQQTVAELKQGQAEADKVLRKAGLPVARIQAPPGCGVDHNVRIGPITNCQLPATLDGHTIILFLGPYFLSNYSDAKHLTLAAESLALKNDSEVDVSLGCGYGSAPSGETATTRCRD